MTYAHPPSWRPTRSRIWSAATWPCGEPGLGLWRDATAGLWEFVENGDFTIASADDAVGHHDAVTPLATR
jgi:hypothetical protein